jgi:glycosyltransferase involved in cell wall biosynthesis
MNGSGLLVPVGNVKALAQAMAWIVKHSDQAKAMGEAGRRQMAAYDIQHIIDLHDQLYTRALADESIVSNPVY